MGVSPTADWHEVDSNQSLDSMISDASNEAEGQLPALMADGPADSSQSVARLPASPVSQEESALDGTAGLVRNNLLLRFPNTGFGLSLGICGTAVLWRAVADSPRNPIGEEINWFFWFLGIVSLGFTFITYVFKATDARTRWMVSREWKHPIRRYFFTGPHLSVLMLCLAAPQSALSSSARRTCWVLCFFVQSALAIRNYRGWMYSGYANLGKAGTPYLLSVIGWFLLCVLANQERLLDDWQIDMASFCFGIGSFFYTLSLFSIFLRMHKDTDNELPVLGPLLKTEDTVQSISKCSTPAHFLILAPASVGAIGLSGFSEPPDFGRGSRCIFGYALLMLFVLVSTSTGFKERPAVFGSYWPYVFPTAALATCGVKYHDSQGSVPSEVLAWFLIGVNCIALFGVVCRELIMHNMRVCCGNGRWADPLFDVTTTPASTPRNRPSVGPNQLTTISLRNSNEQASREFEELDQPVTQSSWHAEMRSDKLDLTLESVLN